MFNNGWDRLLPKEPYHSQYGRLVENAIIALGKGEEEKAGRLFESVLDRNPEETCAYVGKLLLLLGYSTPDSLSKHNYILASNNLFQLAWRYANTDQREELEKYEEQVRRNVEKMELEKQLEMKRKHEQEMKELETRRIMEEKATEERRLAIEEEKRAQTRKAEQRIIALKNRKLVIRYSKIAGIALIVLLCVISVVVLLVKEATLNKQYREGLDAQTKQEYAVAYEIFNSLNSYRDSSSLALESNYQAALLEMDIGNFKKAHERFMNLKEYKDSATKLTEVKYSLAINAFNVGNFSEALAHFVELGSYKDAVSLANEAQEKLNEKDYKDAQNQYDQGKYDTALEIFLRLGKYKDSANRVVQIRNITSKEASNEDTLYQVRIGPYNQKSDANDSLQELSRMGYPVVLVGSGPYYVQIGAFKIKNNAVNLLSEVTSIGFVGLITTLDTFESYTPNRASREPDLKLALPGSASVWISMSLIPSGVFTMGSPSQERDRRSDEGPQHRVQLVEPFYLGVYEVTQQQWKVVMGSLPSGLTYSPENPITNVSWYDCQSFIQKLNNMGIGQFRLPTEAEWEYACRAGGSSRFPWGEDTDYSSLGQFAWYAANSNKKLHSAGGKLPNTWNLYDMQGNAWEWCSDWYADAYAEDQEINPKGPSIGTHKVIRGGSFSFSGEYLRSSYRDFFSPNDYDYDIGFRLVRAQ